MRPLKIVLLSRWYREENRRSTTGAGGPFQQLAEAVAKLGHEVVVLSQSSEVTVLEKTQIGALEVWVSPREKRRGWMTALRDKWAKRTYGHRKVFSDALDLRDFLAQRGPFDVLWAQCEEPDGLVAGIAAQLGVKLPPVLTQIHALRYRFERGVPVFTGKPALGLAFRHAARLIANSDLVADNISAYAGPHLDAARLREKTRVVFPNLTHEFLQAAGELAPDSAVRAGRVLFLGAVNEKKGVLVFMEAVRKLKESGETGLTFVVLGDFTEKNHALLRRWNKELEEMREWVASGRLELPGKVSAFDVIHQIKRAGVVVLPSLFDEFSRALIEALVLGRPVITTDRVGAAPLVKEHQCGLVIAPNDTDALVRAIREALVPGAPYAANAGALAHRLQHEFSPETLALQMAHHLNEIAC
jgi:glycosyltransferase involved in cell wall biosynthesis